MQNVYFDKICLNNNYINSNKTEITHNYQALVIKVSILEYTLFRGFPIDK